MEERKNRKHERRREIVAKNNELKRIKKEEKINRTKNNFERGLENLMLLMQK